MSEEVSAMDSSVEILAMDLSTYSTSRVKGWVVRLVYMYVYFQRRELVRAGHASETVTEMKWLREREREVQNSATKRSDCRRE